MSKSSLFKSGDLLGYAGLVLIHDSEMPEGGRWGFHSVSSLSLDYGENI